VSDAGAAAVRVGARDISRRFGDVVANDRIDFGVAPGTIHAIVGGNGAGKSTLMRILQGLDRPDAGTVILDDRPVRLASPADAFAHGIGMVHQEFMLVPERTLLENMILAREPIVAGGIIDRAAARAAGERVAALAGAKLDWDMRAADTPVHLRQVLEILRLLYRDADVLILDEPTAVLAPAQIRELIALLRRLKQEGRTILFISHKLDEVMDASDVITVLRHGRVVGTMRPAETSNAQLVELMVGEPVELPTVTPAAAQGEPPLLSLEGLVARDGRGLKRLGPVDLALYRGEIVGIAGVAGNGQDELVACAAGLGTIESGAIFLDGAAITRAGTRRLRELGIGYLSADRAAEGLCLAASIRDNLIAGGEHRPPFSRAGLLRPAAIRAGAERALAGLSVQFGKLGDAVGSLSGGNQQRLAIAREFGRKPRILIAVQPTRGVDIAGIAFIHRQIVEFRNRGGAVLLVSEELDEILSLSDRIIGLHGGRITGELPRAAANLERVGRLMLGEAAA